MWSDVHRQQTASRNRNAEKPPALLGPAPLCSAAAYSALVAEFRNELHWNRALTPRTLNARNMRLDVVIAPARIRSGNRRILGVVGNVENLPLIPIACVPILIK